MMSTTPKPGDRLRAHAEHLRSGRLTWVQGSPGDGEACLCYADEGAPFGVMWFLGKEELGALRTVVGTPLVVFNDAPGRTLPEVISALEAAADLLDKEGE